VIRLDDSKHTRNSVYGKEDRLRGLVSSATRRRETGTRRVDRVATFGVPEVRLHGCRNWRESG